MNDEQQNERDELFAEMLIFLNHHKPSELIELVRIVLELKGH